MNIPSANFLKRVRIALVTAMAAVVLQPHKAFADEVPAKLKPWLVTAKK